MTDVKPYPLPAGYTLYIFDIASSTMDEAHKLAKDGASQGTLVLASKQTKGRGRRGSAWVSEIGNLHLSIVLRPRFFLKNLSYLSFIMSVATGHALLPFLKPGCTLIYKWPNDILLNNAKIGGCLLEVERGCTPDKNPAWVIAGLGLNLKIKPKNVPYATTSLFEQGINLKAQDFLSFFCVELSNLLSLVESEGFELVKQMWLRRAFGVGELIKVHVAADTSYEGRFEGINDDGALILKNAKGQRFQVSTGQIMLAAAS